MVELNADSDRTVEPPIGVEDGRTQTGIWNLLKEVPAPERTNNVQGTLAEAYEAIVDIRWNEWTQRTTVRHGEIIDNAATEIMRLPPETVNRWRMLLRNEPRINNRLADIKAMP